MYGKILDEFKKNDMNVNDLKILYGSLFRTIKRMKRDVENNLKFQKTDPQAYLEKLESEGKIFVPLTLQLGKTKKMKEFDFEQVIDYKFEILEYTNQELCSYAEKMIEYCKMSDEFGIDQTKLHNLIETICKNYNVVPYHHFSHAFSVFQLLFHCYNNSQIKNLIPKFDFFASLIASLAHDLNHKGVNNAYKIKRKSSKSLLYCEQSVLENMHSSKLFNLFRDKNLDIISNLKDLNQRNHLKKSIVTFIMATDMAKHAKLLEKFKKRVSITLNSKKDEKNNNIDSMMLSSFGYNFDNQNDRTTVLKILVHACDIGNPLLPYTTYMNWSTLLAQEFNEQTLKEAKNLVDVTDMFKFIDYKKFIDGQIFFSKILVLPLWTEFSNLFPDLKHLHQSLKNNIETLENEKKKIN